MTTPARPSIRTDLRARAAYSEGAGIYRIIPQGVACPATTEELMQLVRWAADTGTTLTPRGAGSGMPGGNVGHGVVVDLTQLDSAPLAITAEGRAHAGAAVTWAAVAEAARPHGLRILPDPSSGRWATIGGMIATNAAGPRSVKHGPVRPWVDAVTIVTADGELTELRRGHRPDMRTKAVRRFHERVHDHLRAEYGLIRDRTPRVAKSSSGYALAEYLESGDLVDLIIGSEGTLAIVTGAEWRLAPVPGARSALRVALRHRADLGAAVAALLPHAPAALELLDASFLRFVAGHAEVAGRPRLLEEAAAILLVEFEEADQDEADAVAARAATELAPLALDLGTAGEMGLEALWAVRHAASPLLAGLGDERRSLQVIEDACVPIAQLGAYLELVEAVTARHGVPAVAFGHAGDGHVHVNLLPDTTRVGWEESIAAIFDEVSLGVLRLGGVLSGEHGDGRLRSLWVEQVHGPALTMLFRAVKEAFDPHGILNPGVILPNGTPAITSLKAGAAAMELPADIAAGLRAVERAGDWGRWKMELAGDSPDPD
ncbi:MAG: FAD-binding oxidoreductase [Gemmatimonadales bacterium]